MKYKNKKGIAIPIVLGVILCLGCYIASLSWSMINSRNRYEKTYNNRKAYFMARSGLDHLLFKLKTMQRHCYESMLTLESAPEEEKQLLYSVFSEDILVPPDNNYTGEKYEYRVKSFKIKSVDLDSSTLTLELKVTGKYSGYQNSIERLVKISR